MNSNTLQRLERFRAKFNDLAKEFEKDGISLKLGNIRYSDTGFGVKMEGTFMDEDLKEVVEDKKRLNFVVNVKMRHLNIDPECFHKTFEYKGNTYKLIDYNTRKRRCPFGAELVGTDKQYGFPESILLKYFSKEKVSNLN